MARKKWEFDLEDGHHVVEFEQGYFLGSRTFSVDGVTTKERGRALMDHSGQYPVALPGHAAAVWVATNGLTYSFDLIIDGRSLSSGTTSPRPPRPPTGGPRQLQLVGGILLAIGLATSLIAAKLGYDEYRYNLAGATAPAIVDRKSTTSGRYGPNYYLHYHFTDRSGVGWRGEDSVSRGTYDATRPGARFTIVYVTDDPGTNRLIGTDSLPTVVFVGVGAAAMLAYGSYLVLAGRKRLAIIRRLSVAGQPGTATVTKLKSGYVRGIGQTITVEYGYEDPFGQRQRGRGPAMYPSEGMLYSVGKPVRILIDPDRPKDSLLV